MCSPAKTATKAGESGVRPISQPYQFEPWRGQGSARRASRVGREGRGYEKPLSEAIQIRIRSDTNLFTKLV